jgi:predicted Rossmann-fold nucleotide-binding protein
MYKHGCPKHQPDYASMGVHRRSAPSFYNPQINMLDQMVASGFYRQEQRDALVVAATPDELISKLQSAAWPDVTKWVR